MRPGIHPDDQASYYEGRYRAQSVRYGVLTGLEDDPRAELGADHRHYWLAVTAVANQDEWSLREHAAFWTPALAIWPATPGRSATREMLGLTALLLQRAGLTVAEIADHLGFEPDTVRRRIDLGLEVWERDAKYAGLNKSLRRLRGVLDDDPPPLPRVYLSEDEEPPEWTYFNPLIPVRLALGRSAETDRCRDVGARVLRDRWYAKREESGEVLSRRQG